MDTETGQYEHGPSDGLRLYPRQLIRTACCIQRAYSTHNTEEFLCRLSDFPGTHLPDPSDLRLSVVIRRGHSLDGIESMRPQSICDHLAHSVDLFEISDVRFHCLPFFRWKPPSLDHYLDGVRFEDSAMKIGRTDIVHDDHAFQSSLHYSIAERGIENLTHRVYVFFGRLYRDLELFTALGTHCIRGVPLTQIDSLIQFLEIVQIRNEQILYHVWCYLAQRPEIGDHP